MYECWIDAGHQSWERLLDPLYGETARTLVRLSRRGEDFTASASLRTVSLPKDSVTVRLDTAGAV